MQEKKVGKFAYTLWSSILRQSELLKRCLDSKYNNAGNIHALIWTDADAELLIDIKKVRKRSKKLMTQIKIATIITCVL
jgi:hypothetical protein